MCEYLQYLLFDLLILTDAIKLVIKLYIDKGRNKRNNINVCDIIEQLLVNK